MVCFTAIRYNRRFKVLFSEYFTRRSDVIMAAINEISARINVDVSEALTGLKAIQREAKKATQALRELEQAQKAVAER